MATEEYLSPEAVVHVLGALIVSAVLAATTVTLYKDEGIRNYFAKLFAIHRPKNRKKEKKSKRSSPQTAKPKLSTKAGNESWKEIFKVEELLTETNNATVLPQLEGRCERCLLHTAKRHCKLNACGKCCRGDPSSVCQAHKTGYEAANNELNNALQYGYVEVDISYSNLKTCPPQIQDLETYVTWLNLSNNRLCSIPDTIGSIQGLRNLFLQYNHLTDLPESICFLSNLVELDVKNNSISSLPTGIGGLRQLTVLCVMNNFLTTLPDSIGQLQNLQELSIHSNNLQSLPDQLCQIKSLKSIFCGENKLTHLPSNIGNLTKLEELDLSYNVLTELPHSICYCRQLSRVWLNNNKLQHLPSQIGLLKNLKELHIRRNCLKYFPMSITELPLYTFSAQHNPVLKESQIRSLNHTPVQTFPPLLELSARAVSANNIPISTGDVPFNLEDLLSRHIHCSKCGRRVFQYYRCQAMFKLVGVYYRLPLYELSCSPHNHDKCVQ